MAKLREPEPLEAVFLRLEQLYASDRSTRDARIYGDGSRSTASSFPDGLNDCMLPCLIAVCLIPRNEPDDFARLFEYFASLSSFHETVDLGTLVLRLRTALFKCTPLTGVVQVSNALEAMFAAVNRHPDAKEILAGLPQESTKKTKTAKEDAEAGEQFFRAIYEKHADRILDNIGRTCPDLSEMIINELYGANLARDEILSWRETVLIEFVGCAALDCPAQAKGHFFGCKNLKVGKLNVAKAIQVVKEIGSWTGHPLDEERMPFLGSEEKWAE